jgi:hypothetical protein
MPFSSEGKFLIKVLREEKHYSYRKLLKEFPNKNWSHGGLDRLLKNIDSRRTVARRLIYFVQDQHFPSQ